MCSSDLDPCGAASARAHQRAAVGTLTPDFLRSLLPPTLTVEAVERARTRLLDLLGEVLTPPADPAPTAQSAHRSKGTPPPSVHAAEGTAAHQVLTWALQQNKPAAEFIGTELAVDGFEFVVDIEMARIAAGTVALHDARTKRRWNVELEPFEIGVYAVTQEQLAELIGWAAVAAAWGDGGGDRRRGVGGVHGVLGAGDGAWDGSRWLSC